MSTADAPVTYSAEEAPAITVPLRAYSFPELKGRTPLGRREIKKGKAYLKERIELPLKVLSLATSGRVEPPSGVLFGSHILYIIEI